MHKNIKNLYCIIGPSGCGKTTISELLESKYDVKPVISYTTRPKRFPEETGHTFVTPSEFAQLGEMIAYTRFDNNDYGITEECIENSNSYIIDPAGLDFFKHSYKGNKHIIVIGLQARLDTIINRMRDRGDSDTVILNRLINDASAFSSLNDISDIKIYTDNLTPEQVCDKIWALICEFEK